MACILLRVSSGTPPSKVTVADANELLHERGRGLVMFAFRSPSVLVDAHDETEEDVITLARLPYGVKKCRLSALDWDSGPVRDSRKENVPDLKANTDCERRRASRRCGSLRPGRSVVEGAVT